MFLFKIKLNQTLQIIRQIQIGYTHYVLLKQKRESDFEQVWASLNKFEHVLKEIKKKCT